MPKVPIDFEFSKFEGDMGMPELFESVIPGRIRDHQSNQCAEHKYHAAGGLNVQEPLDRNEPAGHFRNGYFIGAFATGMVNHSELSRLLLSACVFHARNIQVLSDLIDPIILTELEKTGILCRGFPPSTHVLANWLASFLVPSMRMQPN
jgi:hypothetical protein